MLAVSLLSSIKRERIEMATLKSVRLGAVLVRTVATGMIDGSNSRPGPDKSDMRLRGVVGVGEELDGRVGVESVVPANLPHVGAVEVRLGEAEDDEGGDGAGELERHEPPGASPGDARPFAENEVVAGGTRHLRFAAEDGDGHDGGGVGVEIGVEVARWFVVVVWRGCDGRFLGCLHSRGSTSV